MPPTAGKAGHRVQEGRGQGTGAITVGAMEKVTSELLAKGQPVLMALFITFILLFFFFQSRPERREIAGTNR